MTLEKFFEQTGLPCADDTIAKLGSLADIVLDWNTRINVTAIRDRDEFLRKNIIDSLTLGSAEVFKSANRILDMGTGGGFPGLPLAIVFPEKQFVLVDAIGKKLKVVADAAEKLGLSNVTVVHARAEGLGRDKHFRGSFPLVTSRAVANLSTLCEYCLPFVKTGGFFAAYKTEDSLSECKDAENALRILGGKQTEILPDGIAGSGHLFVLIQKTGPSPAAYPRKAGTPSKEPL